MAGSADLDLYATSNGFGVFAGIEEHDTHQHKLIPDQIAGSIRDGFTNAYYIECHPGDIWSNNNTVRCLCAKYLSGTNGDPDPVSQGDENWYVVSFLIPTSMSPAADGLLWELHHPASLYNVPALGVAPHAIQLAGGKYEYRHLGGNGTSGQGYAVGNYHIPLVNIVYGQWVDFLIHHKLDEAGGAGNALTEVWVDTSGTGSFAAAPNYTSTQSNLPYYNGGSVHNVQLYQEQGFYSGSSSISKQMITNHMGSARRLTQADALAVLGGGTPPTPPPTVTEPGRFLGGDFQPGAFTQGSPDGYMVAQQEVMTYSGTIDAIKQSLVQKGGTGTDNRILCVWDRDAATGKPGVLLGSVAPFSFSNSSPDGDYGGPITQAPVHRNIGDPIFIGFINGGTGNVAGSPSDHPGTTKFHYELRAYSLGPANWDPAIGGVDDIRETIWVEGNKDAVTGTFGGMTVTDDFNRANVGPPPSGSWTGGLMT